MEYETITLDDFLKFRNFRTALEKIASGHCPRPIRYTVDGSNWMTPEDHWLACEEYAQFILNGGDPEVEKF